MYKPKLFEVHVKDELDTFLIKWTSTHIIVFLFTRFYGTHFSEKFKKK